MTDTSTNDGAAKFTPGELVDVTIRGARVVHTYLTSTVFDINHGGTDFELPHGPNVRIARVAPAEWPPQPADVWRDNAGVAWMALGNLAGGVEMVPAKGGPDAGGWQDPIDVLGDFGPMRLEYRPGWTPPGEPTIKPAEPFVDERAEMIAGIRELADLLEQRPNLPFAPWDWPFGPGPDGVKLWAEVLGTTPEARAVADGIHWTADGMLSGLRLHAYWIDKTGAGLNAPMPSDEEIAAEIDAAEIAAEMADETQWTCGNCGRLAGPDESHACVPAPREPAE